MYRFLPLFAALSLLCAVAPATRSAPAAERPSDRAWTGKWIWTDGDPAPRNSYTYFRKSFDVGGSRRGAKVHLTADSRYQLFLNGELIGRGPVRSDRRWLYYDTWDLSDHLKRGRNVLAVLVHHLGEWTFQYMEGRGGLIADVTDGDGKTLAATDSSWKGERSAAWQPLPGRMDLQIGFSEIYDARKAPENWKAPAFDDAAWPRAKEIGAAGMEPWPHLLARDIPPMREEPVTAKAVLEVAEVHPQIAAPKFVSQGMAAEARSSLQTAAVENADGAIGKASGACRVKTSPGADASLLIDFGREVTGFPHFRIRGAKGGEVVDIGYGEVLQEPNGAFVPMSSGKLGRLNPDRDGVHYADRYLCRAGEQEYQTFDKRAFRYVLIDVRNAPDGIELDNVGILFSTYPVENLGTFKCSDERLNRIWEIGRYTCQVNMEDGYTDCPWRERGQWWGDARVESLISYYCFGDTKLIRKALRQNAQSMNEEGMTWGVYPTDWDGGRLPSFTLIWVSTLLDYYQYTADRDLVKELYPKVRYTLDTFFGPRVGPRGLLKDVPYWVFIDWAPVDSDGESGSLNAYYYDALRSAGAMGRLLNDPSAAEYEKRATAVKAAMNQHLWDPAAHAYRDSIRPDGKRAEKISQQTNSLCVLFDIAPAAERQAVLDTIYAPGNKGKVVEAGSPYFSYYQLAALYHAGRDDQALQYIRTNWGRMLDWGATTWWEMWNPGASFCHGWSGGPTFNLGAQVLGVQPLKPGFTEVRVAPQWVGLQYATGVVPTAKGPVKVAWQRDERSKTAALRVEAPKGVPVEITLPGTGTVKVNRKERLPEDVKAIESPAGSTRYRVEKGGTTLLELVER